MNLRKNTRVVGGRRSEDGNYLNSIPKYKILKIELKKKANFTHSNFVSYTY